MTRRPSAALTPGSVGRDRRDLDHTDYFGSRTETPRRDGPSSSYQSQTAPTPAAAAGLDYGPPPSVPTPASSTVDKPVANKAPSAKADTAQSSGSAFQPPSGPKADRTSSLNPPAQQQKPPIQQENVTKSDFTPRPFRPPVAPAVVATSDSIGKPGDSKADHKPSLPQTPDKSMPANVPVGPRASLGVGYKPRQPSSEPAPAAPASSKAMPPDHRNVAIPKGPRFIQEQWSTAGLSNRTTWVSPEYSRSKPSIMNPLGRDRPSFAPPAGPRSQTILPPHSEKPRIFPSTTSQGGGATSAFPTNLGQKAALGGAHTLSRPAGMQASEDVDMSLPDSSEDEDEFDEDDYAASEEKHRQERILLEARKPLPLLQDASIRHLLVRIQFLNMIMNEVIPKSSATADTFDDKAKAVEPPPIGLPSPEERSEEREERPEIKHPQPRGRPLSQPAINPIPTPPIDDLPFLFRGSPKRMAFDESDNEVENEAITTLFRQEFENEAFEWNSELQDLQADYRHRYPLWKQDVAMLDQERRELQPSPAPASPAPSAAPSVTPSLSHERTRGARNTTEADLQAAILMSQQSLKEEEERREREAASSSQPNYDTEAHVPSMMKPSEVELNFFEDTNRLIPTTLALDVFAYVPPEDDFTEEEQLTFIQAYCQYPKKWGRIAESLPGRSYKDCITHYYLTKNETKYKIMWRNSQPRKKRGRAATKPRSTALMSEMVYENDGDAAIAVTDTGRPRRAAAPTFGDTPGDSDISTPVPQSKRLALSKEANGDQVPAKSGRGRKAGGVAKPRRTKAQIQADQQQAAQLIPAGATDGSPQKVGAAPRERSRTLLRAENGLVKCDGMGSPEMSRIVDVEMAQYSQLDAERLPSSMALAASNQPTSYWSVPEQQKFPQLIAYFGRDFGSIADFMKTKTVTMVTLSHNRQKRLC
jgi:Myb-like DNA-binding domain